MMNVVRADIKVYLPVSEKTDILICGGIGGGAKTALAEAGIKLFGGISGNADQAVDDFVSGKISYNPNVQCTEHENEHSFGEHTCGEDKHGCPGNY